MTKREEPTTIKKYANRRLYNTGTSTYVTLEDLSVMVKDEEDFVVYDAKSGDDITRTVLTQIIFEQEAKGENLLPIPFPAAIDTILRQFDAIHRAELFGIFTVFALKRSRQVPGSFVTNIWRHGI